MAPLREIVKGGDVKPRPLNAKVVRFALKEVDACSSATLTRLFFLPAESCTKVKATSAGSCIKRHKEEMPKYLSRTRRNLRRRRNCNGKIATLELGGTERR